MTVYEQVVLLESEGASFVLVTLVDTVGSTPQDAAAKMIVTPHGHYSGTVGGGKVEAAALRLAGEILEKREAKPRFVSWTLKGDVGMTCGGSVKFYFEPHFGAGPWSLAVFGAGHVAQALLPVLAPLPAQIVAIDSRPEWLARLPRAHNVRILHTEKPEEVVPTLADDTYVLVMTMGHATDRPILRRALTERSFPFVGVIGSDAKATILRRELISDGLTPAQAATFHCPVGLDLGTNHPHEIAISIAGQLLAVRDGKKAGRAPARPGD
ncbi:MAG TPA: xanthine dehydrogenase accessory protein XdhC [Opitutaceae bacterium]